MDGTLAIEANRAALKRIVETLVDMAGFAAPSTSPLMGVRSDRPQAGRKPTVWLPERRTPGAMAKGRQVATKSREGVNDREVTPTRRPDVRRPPHKGEVERLAIPRILWRAILKILRPAEAATRRLIIAAASGLAVPPPPPRRAEPKPETIAPQLRRFGIAVTVAPASATRDGISSPAKRGVRRTGEAGDSPQGTAEGGGGGAPRIPAFPLFDPPRHLGPPRPRFVPAHAAPRIFVPGYSEPSPLPPPPAPGDLVSAERLTRRLAALAAALDDLPGQARRYARWQSRRDAGPAPPRRPIRRGRPPGGRLFRFDPGATHPRHIREIDEILAHAHALAVHALEYPDTS